MDSDISAFQGLLDAPSQLQNLPRRRIAPMPAQPIVPWTPMRVAGTFMAWLMEETYIPVPVRPDA
jgi:hypothetical protein